MASAAWELQKGFVWHGREQNSISVGASAQSWMYCLGSKFVSMVQVTALPPLRR